FAKYLTKAFKFFESADPDSILLSQSSHILRHNFGDKHSELSAFFAHIGFKFFYPSRLKILSTLTFIINSPYLFLLIGIYPLHTISAPLSFFDFFNSIEREIALQILLYG